MVSVGRVHLPVPVQQLPLGGAAAELLLKQTNTDYDTVWDVPLVGGYPAYFAGSAPQSAGMYSGAYVATIGGTTSFAVNGPKTWYVPTFFGNPSPVAKMSIYQGTAGGSGTAFIFSIYSMGSNGLPATVLAKTASAAATSAPGSAVSLLASVTVPAGWAYLALTSVTSSGTVPTVNNLAFPPVPFQPGNNGAVPSATTGYSFTSANSAPVNNPTVSVDTSQAGPFIWLVAP